MSLDATLLSIEKSLSRIAAALESRSTVAPAAPIVHVPAPVAMAIPAPVQPVYAPVPVPVPVLAPVAVLPPVFVQPVQQPVATGNPFGKDEAGGEQTLMGYTMDAYRTMGPLKGGGINNVLIAMNCKNINDVQPAQYHQFHAAVEALKVSQ